MHDSGKYTNSKQKHCVVFVLFRGTYSYNLRGDLYGP